MTGRPVAEPEIAGDLVEGLTGGVVDGLAEQAVATGCLKLDQEVWPPETNKTTSGGSKSGCSRVDAKRCASSGSPDEGHPQAMASAFAPLTPPAGSPRGRGPR